MTDKLVETDEDKFVRIEKIRFEERRQGLRPACIGCSGEYGLEKSYDIVCNNCWGELMEGWENEE